MTELSDADLSLKIAEYLEPKPENEPWTFPCQSPKRGWRTPVPAICDGKSHWNYWVPQSFVTDTAMTVMLMEKLLLSNSGGMAFQLGREGFIFCTVVISGEIAGSSGINGKGSIGRAAAEAFARAKGLL